MAGLAAKKSMKSMKATVEKNRRFPKAKALTSKKANVEHKPRAAKAKEPEVNKKQGASEKDQAWNILFIRLANKPR